MRIILSVLFALVPAIAFAQARTPQVTQVVHLARPDLMIEVEVIAVVPVS
jgi:hypothetical protein